MIEVALSLAISSHLGMDGNYNNLHPRVNLEYNDFMVGGFYNSESQLSLYLGKRYEFNSIDIELGLVTGYSGADVAPMIKINYNGFFIAPGYANGQSGAIVGYEWKF